MRKNKEQLNYSTIQQNAPWGASTVIGALNLSDKRCEKNHTITKVPITRGVYIGGDVSIGGGESVGLYSWVDDIPDFDEE
ncbi:hypothetical protein ACF3DV_15045 [Chlorogloeopsis fritschii PCC 9212]|uniref:Uncharacterized protein n=1 Tax=Chlorogloeopsis fritschii PCC 6912 TaxID=211165 RepID=A0A433NL06_CHLFR|nr:hypothetical protein [Chlorogloeopsis fritschii]RUR83497.1 hypothetical protein PCC6912_23300 [Chlorogloeopsis fritschii PCC 6912]